LKKYNLKYEDLNQAERGTFNMWLESLQKGALTIEKIKEYITNLKVSVEQELTKYDLGSKQDLFLKARLRNYMLLEAFLMSPQKAKEAIERSLAGVKK
jgi:hypothetical protein